MAEQLEIRKQLTTMLKTICNQVFYENAKDIRQYPFIVYSLDSASYGEIEKQFSFEVNIVDFGDSTERVETLTEQVWNKFNHYYHIDNSLGFVTYPNVMNSIAEEDKNIKHRRILFDLVSVNGD